METALVNGLDNSTEEKLRSWERGFLGPMVSSHDATQAEKEAWGLIPLL